ncbi:MAG: autotransporter outer membrane beta-barrel domain-containing protein, partial [Desulfovibrio sp.]|nr:autotransporter outer membrane beta-barrel domain-containing protein [Desulfovibrio sp.]
IIPLYQNSNAWNVEAGHFDMNWHGGLGGVALGADYTLESALRLGIAFNIGGGYATGRGDLADTENRFNFWGLGAYAGWSDGAFGLTADINYTSTFNDVEQDVPPAMGMRNLKADIPAHALSAGLRGEYKIRTDFLDIIPHIGVRYMNLAMDGYDVKGGGTVLEGERISQDIWTFPVGLAFSKNIETGNGWFFKPGLDLAVIPAAGDIEAKTSVRFTGTGSRAELESRVMDYVSYMGGIGLDFGNQNVSFGLNYNIQLSEHATAHGVFGTFRYEF